MADTLTLEIATPLGLALKTDAEAVQAPSVHGEFGVLPGHLPLLAALKPGVIRYRTGGKTHVVAVSAGFVEAGPEKVLLLTDQFARPLDIDEDSVRQELSDAEKALAVFGEMHEGRGYEELQRRVDWCNARLTAKADDRA